MDARRAVPGPSSRGSGPGWRSRRCSSLAPFFFASGLMAPLWGVVVVISVWAVLFALAIGLLVKRRPLWVLPVPVLAVLFWWSFLSLGGKFLGWTA